MGGERLHPLGSPIVKFVLNEHPAQRVLVGPRYIMESSTRISSIVNRCGCLVAAKVSRHVSFGRIWLKRVLGILA